MLKLPSRVRYCAKIHLIQPIFVCLIVIIAVILIWLTAVLGASTGAWPRWKATFRRQLGAFALETCLLLTYYLNSN